MPNIYRAFPIDDAGRVCRPAQVLDVKSDDEALALARTLLDGHDLAVWQGERHIAVVKRGDTGEKDHA